MDSSELVAQFCQVTAADPDLAEQYLKVSDNNLEQAIALYFESGGASLESQQQHRNVPDDDEPVIIPPEEEEVRERIAPVTEQLVNPLEHHMGLGGFGGGVPQDRPGIFNQHAPRSAFEDEADRDHDDDEEEFLRQTVGSSRLSAHESRLAALFRPPFDLITRVDFERAKDIAQSERKWILVNIQNNREFSSQQLNRDLWSDKRVKEVVRDNFVFLQYDSTSPSGEMYRQLYPFEDFPHISILDPRTGEQLRTWSEVPKNTDFIDALFEFLTNFSLEPGHKNPLAQIPKHKTNVEHMTEEEQIQMALRESLNQKASSSMDEEDDWHEEYSDSDIEVLDYPPPSASHPPPSAAKSDHEEIEIESDKGEENLSDEDKFALIAPIEEPEPTADPKTTTRLQFRLADGTRAVRRFNLTDTVRTVYGVVKHAIPQVKGKYFSMSSERKNLIELLEQTLESANLKNSVVMIEIDDD
ncbi:UBX domain-containing protein 5 [Trichomonascus vanleenenianus]|uniref:DNA protein crosslink repair co-factor UBX5 n=1 Tax=Trichomonascus vanleenenianus TaxID=2268995 RepID=UPI003ECA9B24